MCRVWCGPGPNLICKWSRDLYFAVIYCYRAASPYCIRTTAATDIRLSAEILLVDETAGQRATQIAVVCVRAYVCLLAWLAARPTAHAAPAHLLPARRFARSTISQHALRTRSLSCRRQARLWYVLSLFLSIHSRDGFIDRGERSEHRSIPEHEEIQPL